MAGKVCTKLCFVFVMFLCLWFVLSTLLGGKGVICVFVFLKVQPVTTSQHSSPAIWQEKINEQKMFLPPQINHLSSTNYKIERLNDGNVSITGKLLNTLHQNQIEPPNTLMKQCAILVPKFLRSLHPFGPHCCHLLPLLLPSQFDYCVCISLFVSATLRLAIIVAN